MDALALRPRTFCAGRGGPPGTITERSTPALRRKPGACETEDVDQSTKGAATVLDLVLKRYREREAEERALARSAASGELRYAHLTIAAACRAMLEIGSEPIGRPELTLVASDAAAKTSPHSAR